MYEFLVLLLVLLGIVISLIGVYPNAGPERDYGVGSVTVRGEEVKSLGKKGL